MRLIEKIQKNQSIEFIDAKSSKSLKIKDIAFIFDFEEEKKLAFLYLENNLESIEILLQFLHSNHCFALLNPAIDLDFKKHLENKYHPNFIFDQSRFENLEKRNSVKKIHPKLKLLLSTSGSTGSPKMVKISENNIIENAYSILNYLPINQKDTCPLELPLFYAYGFSIFTTNCMAGGKIICNLDDILQTNFWNDFEKFAFTSLAGVPFVYEMLKRIGFTKKTYPSLKYLTQAGGKLNEKTLDHFADYSIKNKIDFFVMYGQTEATARMSFLHPKDLKNKINSIGKPILNGSFSIDYDTKELIYTGPNVFGGYANSVKDLENFEENNCLNTGDLARIDSEGFYYIIGRMKRFIKIFGSRINLDEIELLLKQNISKNNWACIGKSDKKLIVFTTNFNFEKAKIKDFLKSKLNLHPKFIELKFIEEIPKNANQKTNYSELKSKD